MKATTETFPSKTEICELWHIARAAGHNSRYDRMIYAKQELVKRYPSASPKQLWIAIDENTQVGF